jgi:hypothetical protein
MAKIVMHAPATGPFATAAITCGGGLNTRKYVPTPGTPQLVNDYDAAILEANGWTNGAEGGTTAQRPTTGLYVGRTYNDTTVGARVHWDGKAWRHATTGATV